MTPKVASNCLLTILLNVLFLGCTSSSENNIALTVYVSADDKIAREVFVAFTKKTGIDVVWVADTEATKNTALVQRLVREQQRPVADVFWSSEILGKIRLVRENILTPCNSPLAQEWPEHHRDLDYKWFAFSPRARVIAYNPAKIKEEELPRTWWEYGDAVMADPRFGTTGTHVAVLAKYPEKSRVLFQSMKGRPLLGGNAATLQAVIDGTAKFAMTDTDDVHAAQERGKSVAMFMPRHHDGIGGGTLLIPNTVGVIRGCGNPKLAEQFVEFLLSDEVAILLATSPSHNIPLQPNVAEQFPHLVVEDPLIVDFYESEKSYKKQLDQVMIELSK